MVDIADVPFTQVPDEELKQFTSKIKEIGSYRGYKPREFWVRRFSVSLCVAANPSPQTIDNGVRDQIEQYNSKFVFPSSTGDLSIVNGSTSPSLSATAPEGVAAVPS